MSWRYTPNGVQVDLHGDAPIADVLVFELPPDGGDHADDERNRLIARHR
ncbi:hypothetical protein ABZ863_28090 [Saccharomonospora sp. NPDC046836]